MVISIGFITYRNRRIKKIDKFLKFKNRTDNLLEHRLLLVPCKYSDLSMKTFWHVQTVMQQSHANICDGSVHYVNHLVRQFEFFNYVFGHCCNQHWRQVFLSTKVCCCNDQLTPQSHELVAICVSHCKTCTSRKSLLLSFFKTMSFTFDKFETFLDQGKCPNLSRPLAKST